MKRGVTTYSIVAAYFTFFLSFSARFCGWDILWEMSLVQPAHGISSNDIRWWAFLVDKSSDYILLKFEKGGGSFHRLVIEDIGIINCQLEEVNGNFFVPVAGHFGC